MTYMRFELKKSTARAVVAILAVFCAVSFMTALFTAHEERSKTYAEDYPVTLDIIIYDAGVNYDRITDKSSAQALFQSDVMRRYERLIGNDVSREVRGWDLLISSPIPYASSMASSVAIALFCASAELRGNLTLLSFRERRGQIARRKIVFAVASSVSATVLTSVSASLGVLIFAGFKNGSAPVASIPAYLRCPYDISAAGAFALRLAITAAASAALAVTAMLAVFTLRRTVYVITAAIAAVAADIAIAHSSADVLSLFYNFTFSGALSDDFLTRYSGLGVGIFIPRTAVMLAVPTILTAISSALFVLSVVKYSSVSESRRKDFRRGQTFNGHGAIYYGLRRLCTARAFVAVGVMLALDCLLLSFGTANGGSSWNSAYRRVVDETNGMTYDEQTAYIGGEIAESRDQIANAYGARDLFESGQISSDEYLEIVRKSTSAEFRMSILEMISDKLDAIGSYRPAIDGILIYDIGWRAYFAYKSIFPMLAVLMAAAPYIFCERATGYERILNASFCGDLRGHRRFIWRKLIFSIVTSAAIIFIFNAIELLMVHTSIGLPSWTENAVSAGIEPWLGALPLYAAVIIRYLTIVAVTSALICIAAVVNIAVSREAKR